MGGIGKTTLAQLAYNDEEVKAHFDMRIWVCVSDPFDEIRIAKAIVEQVGQSGPSLVELESVLQNMCKSIKERKLLIVLDDVWVEDYKKWEPLKHCLQHGAKGSTILVTTRKERVAQMMGSSCMFQLQNLSEGDTWWLFSQLAFLGRASEDCETLEEIGKKIVSKCKGLPLAAKTLGSLMRFRRTKAEWQNVLDSEIWELEEAEKGLLPPLLFSLYDLPSAIRRCFLFCAIFPKDYEIKKDVLIKLWMAQGYLSSSRSREMEVTGQEYFESLAAHSLFQDFIKDDDGSIIQCKMHDIVHDFAQFLTRNECVIMEVDSKKKPSMDAFYKKVRHLTLTCASDAQMPVFNYNAVNSRTLLNLAEDIALPHLFDNLTRLRALDLNAAAIKEVPVKVRNLMHLRYLNLSKNTRLHELPEAVCDLSNLESLILNWCQSLKRLTQGIGKLINLRHLELEETSNLRKFPKGIGKLSSLRTLSKFIVRGDGVKKACNMVLLKNMKHLQGILYLDGLENLISGGESKKAELKNKKNLLGLRLDFYGQKREGGIHNDDDDDDVIEELQPNPNLASLHILYYQGTRLPSWIMMLTNMRELILKNCENCENLPPLGNLPSLELLEIWYMYHVKTMSHRFLGEDAHDSIPNTDDVLTASTKIAFPKLKRLGFFGLTEWEDWYDWTSWREDCLIMPRLSCLTIECCPKLKALPHLIQTAPIQVTIRECPILETMLPQGERRGLGQDISYPNQI
ncbi:putative disease resistance protein RGA3 [Quercus lobata]|nr:putative disease resistance protein RGA3 [Quercus lobata]